MKKIVPLTIWVNGQQQTATLLNSIIIYDNLLDKAEFYWQLLDAKTSNLSDGNLTISGQSYIDWNTATDINEDAYVWIADQLGLTLI
jgi:hypothetical protein